MTLGQLNPSQNICQYNIYFVHNKMNDHYVRNAKKFLK